MHARAWGVPWGSWQPARRRDVMSSHYTQCLLLLEFPGPRLSPFWKLLPCQCGQNRVEGPPHPTPPAFPASAPATRCPASLTRTLAPTLLPPPPELLSQPSCHVPLNSLPLAQENISGKIYFCISVNKVSVSCVQLQTGLLHTSVCSASRLQPQPQSGARPAAFLRRCGV